ncbi:MAG: sporulation protein YqfD [Clostridia bacterium]|nr:sporulation protein YqfD [Clostridia bacterium]
MINRFLSRLTGWYVFRSAPGMAAEFLNALNASGAYFWGVKIEGDVVRARVSVFGYNAAVKALGDAGGPESAFGLPFIIYRYRKRAGLAAGTALGLVLMFVSSLFAWDIVVTGNTNVSEKQILASLDSLGVDIGAFIPRIDVSDVNSRLVLALPELSSASLHIDGTVLYVDVIERVRPPEKAERSGVYDVVAARDGVITDIETYNGRAVVKPGDTVSAGQVLISGVFTIGDDPCLEAATHARGKVTAYYYREFVYTVPLRYVFRIRTGRTEEKTVYRVFGNEIRLFLGELFGYEHFEASVKTYDITLGPLKLPVSKTVITVEEYAPETVSLTPDQAREKALEAFEAWYSNDLEGAAEDIEYSTEYDVFAGCVTLYGSVKVTSEIGAERENNLIGNNLLN